MKKLIPFFCLLLLGCQSPQNKIVGADTTKKIKLIYAPSNDKSDTTTITATISPSAKIINDSLVADLQRARDSLRLIHINFPRAKMVDSDTISSRSLTDVPEYVVLSGAKWRHIKLKIYNKRLYKRQPASLGYGKWEYWVTSASSGNFRYVTDKEYNIGDELKITKK